MAFITPFFSFLLNFGVWLEMVCQMKRFIFMLFQKLNEPFQPNRYLYDLLNLNYSSRYVSK